MREATADLVELVLEDHSPGERVNYTQACTHCGDLWPCYVAEVVGLLVKEIVELEQAGAGNVRS